MVAITIICVGALRDKFYREAADEYEKRLGAFCKLKTIETTDEKLASVIPQKAYKIALCVEGKMLSSEELADNPIVREKYLGRDFVLRKREFQL